MIAREYEHGLCHRKKQAPTSDNLQPWEGATLVDHPYNDVLEKARMKAGLKQEDVARRAGIDCNSISAIENLQRHPSLEVAARIAQALNTTPEQLFPSWLREFVPSRQKSIRDDKVVIVATDLGLNPNQLERINYSLKHPATPQMIVEQGEIRGSIEDPVALLSPREKRVLKLRFGLDDGEQRTLKEVGGEFRVTNERIRQIEAKALRKMRHLSGKGQLAGYQDQRHKPASVKMYLNGAINGIAGSDWKRVVDNLKEARWLIIRTIHDYNPEFHYPSLLNTRLIQFTDSTGVALRLDKLDETTIRQLLDKFLEPIFGKSTTINIKSSEIEALKQVWQLKAAIPKDRLQQS